jgi:beta-glucosidase-like glycosyl hydrolase/CubicO group peptidase (beta-lactamase class C family)
MRGYWIKVLVFLGAYVMLSPGLPKSNMPVEKPSGLMAPPSWTDSVMATLTLDEKIAQLMMVAGYTNKDQAYINSVLKLVQNYKVGGVIFFQGGPGRQASVTNLYQSAAKIPLFIAGDYEWGLSMRLDSCQKFPWQMTLGAIQNDSLIYLMGKEMARQFKRIGVNVSFSPVLDVNNNINNPIINARSFGENKYNVVRKGFAYMRGLQDNGVMACGKHFPGHGDTDKDSHKDLPAILHTKDRLDSLEIFPFKKLIENGLQSIMAAHLYVPVLDSTPNLATSLSKRTIAGLLKNELGFKGLVFTDALNMKGVSAHFPKGVVEVLALRAGVDILLMPDDVPLALEKIKEAIAQGKITEDEINERCRKVLNAKYNLGIHKWKPAKVSGIYDDLHTEGAEKIIRNLAEASITVLKNDDKLIPLMNLDTLKIANVLVGAGNDEVFNSFLNRYASVTKFKVNDDISSADADALLLKLASYNLVIVSVHKSDKSPWKSFKFTEQEKSLISKISKKKSTILDVFANPYALAGLPSSNGLKGLIVSYQDNQYAQEMSAQMIFGATGAKGRLPVSVSQGYTAGYGLDTEPIGRLRYVIPEELGIEKKKLSRIKEIVNDAIAAAAFPGCQILAAKDGKVFYYEAFGNHTYSNLKPVQLTDLYDIASVTKITSTLPAVMKLVDEGKIKVGDKLGAYLPETKGTNKENLNLVDILTHQSGLKAWLPFYTSTLDAQKNLKPEYYTRKPDENHLLQVADSIYIINSIIDTIYKKIYESALDAPKTYVYSDLGLYLLARVCEKITGERLDAYVDRNFYAPLGATTTGYNPRLKFSKDLIPPTENDKLFRKQMVHGYVHDQGAAMCGGVAGHAGIFSNANDLAKVMQMYLNKGEYGGKRYISKTTVEEFSKCRFCKDGNRRGLGFDRADPSGKGVPCDCVSYASYGHTGFTGTMVWMDPDNGLLYIFLSNRVHPNAENKLIMSKGVRARVQEVFYDAIPK